MSVSLIGFAAMLMLVFLRVPIAFAMAIVGFLGFAWLNIDHPMGLVPALQQLSDKFGETAMDYSLSVVPLFILMGNFVARAGLSHDLYAASHAFLGHRKGGLSLATIVACGGFSAICGSSLATAATMAKVAMPPMRKYGYADSLATASIAAGGTLGILIPPSVILVIYGFITETSIRELFAAGFLPGLLGVGLYMLATAVTVRRWPHLAPSVERRPWSERWRALRNVWGTVLLFILVIGGIYGRLFTPTEAAGVGAGGAFLIALSLRKLDWRSLYEILVETARTTASLFVILMGALIFSVFVTRAGLPDGLAGIVTGFDVPPYVVIFLIMVVYVILGMVFESLSMLLLTIPVFFPIVMALDLPLSPAELAVWFGIVAVVVTEISLITPPVGLNIFVLSGVLPDVRTGTIFRGVTPFWIADIVRLTILIVFPSISLYLPQLFYG